MLEAAGDGGRRDGRRMAARPTGSRPFRIAPKSSASDRRSRARRAASTSPPSTSPSRSSFASTTVMYFRLSRGIFFGATTGALALRGQTPGDFLRAVQRAPQHHRHRALPNPVQALRLRHVPAVARRWPHCASSAYRSSLFVVLRTTSRAVHRRPSSRPTSSGSRARLWDPRRSTTTSRSSARSCARTALGRRDRVERHHDRGRARIRARVPQEAEPRPRRRASCTRCARARASAGGSPIFVPTGIVVRVVVEVRPRHAEPGEFLRLDTQRHRARDVRRRTRLVRRVGVRESHTSARCWRIAFVAPPRLAAALRSGGRGERARLDGRAHHLVGRAGVHARRARATRDVTGTELVGAVFIVLALLPPTPLVAARPLAITGRLHSALVVVAGLIALANHSAIVDGADVLRAIGAPDANSELIVANLGPERRTRLAPVRHRTQQSDGRRSTAARSISTASRREREAGVARPSPDRVERHRPRARRRTERPACADAEQRRASRPRAQRCSSTTDDGGT